MIVIEVMAFLALLFWLLLGVDRSRRWPREMVLPDAAGTRDSLDASSVIAIVPARNEAGVLPATLPTLLAQCGALRRILLVDDQSDDGTAAVAIGIAGRMAPSCLVQVLTCPPPAADWTGKIFAQEYAYRHLQRQIESGVEQRPDWVLLTDADIRHRCGSVRSLLLRASGKLDGCSYDLVSVMARLRAATVWERLLVPSFVFFFQLLYPFSRIADARSKVSAAAGGCVLVRWNRLVALGGFERLRSEIIDDVAMGKAIKGAGGRVWLGLDTGIESVRAYRRLTDLWQMVSRTAFTQLGYSWILLIATLVGLTVLVISPPLLIAWSLVNLLADAGELAGALTRTLAWAVSAWLLMSAALLPAVRHHGVPAWYAVSLPLAGTLFGLMTATSAWNHFIGKGAVWRGRTYGAAD